MWAKYIFNTPKWSQIVTTKSRKRDSDSWKWTQLKKLLMLCLVSNLQPLWFGWHYNDYYIVLFNGTSTHDPTRTNPTMPMSNIGGKWLKLWYNRFQVVIALHLQILFWYQCCYLNVAMTLNILRSEMVKNPNTDCIPEKYFKNGQTE